jgi:CheY-like chemotaxis protein
MDLEMPNMGGLEAMVEIRRMGIQTPTLAMTAHTDPEVMKICRLCGMNAGLSKPLKRDLLIEALQQYQCPIPKQAL